ncbi:SGNH/GDSL hydrolase family protein [Spirosoma radiotolerans]|uniref:GDSL family lipase n=1 Tax=Spirosoma radiotolerans TaxID=1379870 RepID=A0A0E3ZWX9_9BACT|nr:SGNH/GDSL hydrolase family protein [Spirosoma radiotolerans]AKD56013.1 GDSL family lipase [Spirosoma radiotolerans]
MRKRIVLAIPPACLAVFLYLLCGSAFAQTTPESVNEPLQNPFELKSGDRVVFLGNSLFEDDFQYGYLELAFTTRWPERDVTFRNLGWTGDNVFGVARSTITNPPTGYDLLMEHITKAQPTVVFLGYGGIEAQEGEAGLATFKDGLTKLLDKIDQLGARAILVSPIPILSADSVESLTKRNAMLERYSATIAKMAEERGKRFVDVYKPIQAVRQTLALSEDGIHLNEAGYFYLATILEKALGLPPRMKPATITIVKTTAEAAAGETAAPVKLLETDASKGHLTFTIDEPYLPLPLPIDETSVAAKGAQVLKIAGLKKGIYTLTTDDSEVITASASQWEAGINIKQGPSFEQVRELQHMILKKNELFFFQYRPLNTTYILGMRAHEQGRHAKGLEEQSLIIKWLEGQIAQNRLPKPKVYKLTHLK